MTVKTTKETLKKVSQEMRLNHKALEKCNEDLIISNKKLDKGESEKEKSIEELNSDLEKMMFTISHKVRNSVANILAISTLINEDDSIETDDLKEMLNIIFISAEALNKATEELSKFIRDRKSKL